MDYHDDARGRQAPWHRSPLALLVGGRSGIAGAALAVVIAIVAVLRVGSADVAMVAAAFGLFAVIAQIAMYRWRAATIQRRVDQLSADGCWVAYIRTSSEDLARLETGDARSRWAALSPRHMRYLVVDSDRSFVSARTDESEEGPPLPLRSVTRTRVSADDRTREVLLGGHADVTVDVLWSSEFPQTSTERAQGHR